MKVREREHLTQGGHREEPNEAGRGLGLTSKPSSSQACLQQESRATGDRPQVGVEVPAVSFSFVGTRVHLPTENHLGARKPALPD